MYSIYAYIGLTRDKEEGEADTEGEGAGEGATPRVRLSRAKVDSSLLAATDEHM